MDQPRLSDIENDRSASFPELTTLLRVARGLRVSIDDLLAGVDGGYDRVLGQIKTSPVTRPHSDVDDEIIDVSGYTPHDIPVVAEGEANPQGSLFWTDEGVLRSDVEDRISRPRDVPDPQAYGVRVRGDSMLPIFKPGMTLIVSPNIPVNDGDEVYVQLLSGERLVKVARRVAGGWLLESSNPAYEPRFVRKSEIGAMHPVIYARRKRTPNNGAAKK